MRMFPVRNSSGAQKLNWVAMRRSFPTLSPSSKVFAQVLQTITVHEHDSVHELYPRFLAGGQNLIEFGQVDPAGFLAKQMLARLGRLDRPFGPQPGGQGQIDRIDLFVGQQFIVVPDGLGL